MATQPTVERKRRFRLPLGVFLPLALAGLTALPLLVVFGVAFGTGLRNTESLLEDKVRLIVDGVVEGTRQYLAPAEAAPRFIGDSIDRGGLDPDDPEAMLAAIRFAFVAAPQVNGLTFVHRDGWSVLAYRAADTGAIVTDRIDWRQDAMIRAAVEESGRQREPTYWGTPIYVANVQATMLTFVRLIRDDGAFHAGIAATVRLQPLSAFIARMSPDLHDSSFILAGREQVIAHRSLAEGKLETSALDPLPRLGDVGDPVLAAIWSPDSEGGANPWASVNDLALGRELRLGNDTYLLFYRKLPMLTAGAPWLVGGYVLETELAAEVFRLIWAAGASLAALAVTVVAAFLLGRSLRRPVAELGRLANALGRLDLDDLRATRRSRFTELDDALDSFARTAAALRMFARYVPRRVVELLLERGDAEAMRSRDRVAVVMFTDMVGFSRIAAGLDAEACADFLNAHLRLLTAAIEAEGGIVDKFMGDAVMAFWPIHPRVGARAEKALAASRAALAIRDVMHVDNAAREQPLRARIGLHMGRVIVGNIGTETRLNFTIVGDPVNVAQRIEALGKTLEPGAEVALLLSGGVASLLPKGTGLRALGAHTLAGRPEPVEIFALDSIPTC